MGMHRYLTRAIFSLVRLAPIRVLVGWIFAHMSFAIPVQKLRQTGTLLAFHHPQPAYPLHILIVPRRALSGLEALTETDQDFLVDLFVVVQSLVVEFELAESGYRLVANGGIYQQFPQLHFHLISDR
jgi:histidine triad (HIT) family protein